MTKLKLNFAQVAGEILTREELKKVLGGTDAGSGSGSDDIVECSKFSSCGTTLGKNCKTSDGKIGKCISPQATTICRCE
jgi:hypothetical protein